MAPSTTTTSCSRGSTSSSRRSTSSRRQPRAELTRRTLNAIRSPARRRHRPPVRPDDRDARRPRPRLGRGLRRGGADRHGARDERVAPPARPRGRARAAGGRGWAACCRSTPTRTRSPSSTTCAGASPRHAGRGSSRHASSTRAPGPTSSPGSRTSRSGCERDRLAYHRGDAGRPSRPPRPRARRGHDRRAVAPDRAAGRLVRRDLPARRDAPRHAAGPRRRGRATRTATRSASRSSRSSCPPWPPSPASARSVSCRSGSDWSRRSRVTGFIVER